MTSNVVDSNMFMRCLILSYEHFAAQHELSGRGNWNYFVFATAKKNYFKCVSFGLSKSVSVILFIISYTN